MTKVELEDVLKIIEEHKGCSKFHKLPVRDTRYYYDVSCLVIIQNELKQLADKSQDVTNRTMTEGGHPDTQNLVCKCGHGENYHFIQDTRTCYHKIGNSPNRCKCNKFESKEVKK